MDKACLFGERETLVGIVSEPSNMEMSESPVVLILNANILHRVGPYRLHVDLARELSVLGSLVLRFDLSGVGDSPSRKENKAYSARVVHEVQEAMDYVKATYNKNKFILVGLCAGADSALNTSLQDKRVKGLVLLDGYCHRNIKYYLAHYLPRIIQFSVWKRLCARVFSPQNKQVNEFHAGVREFPTKQQMTRNVTELVNRGVHSLWIYSGGVEDYYNYESQFFDTYGLKKEKVIEVKFYHQAGHTYPDTRHRIEVLGEIVDWYKRIFK